MFSGSSLGAQWELSGSSMQLQVFKVYSNRKEFINDFATGKNLLAVLIKLQPYDESVYVCYKDKDKNWILLEKIRFKDENGCTRFNLYYAPLLLPQENIISVETLDKILDRILGYAIIHPMVTRDKIIKISWGHTVLTNCWRVERQRVCLTSYLTFQTHVFKCSDRPIFKHHL